MQAGTNAPAQPLPRILLIAPSPPPYGGMALQARLLERLLRADGIPVTFVASNLPFPGGLRVAGRIPGLRTLLRFMMLCRKLWIEAGRAGIVHVLAASWLYFFVLVAPAVLIGRIRGKRVVLNYRGGHAGQFFQWWGWAARPILKLADIITTPSEFLAQLIRRRFGVPVLIVSNILDLSAFRFRQRTMPQPKMLVTRHLEKIYDIESVLRAFQVVQRMHPDASLRIAGAGSEESHLRNLVSTWDLKNVTFLGHVPQSDLPAVYDQCDILLNASRVDNFPGALLEAAAAGLVVITTGAGGIPFIFNHGENALIVEPGDWNGLALAVENVLQHSTLAQDLTAAALKVARACDWQEVRKSLYAAYGFEHKNLGRELIAAVMDR